MPELPEVEMIKLSLEKKITGEVIKGVQILNPKSFQGEVSYLLGSKIKKIWRRAKILGIDLIPKSKKAELTLLFHLKMSGQIIFQPKNNKRFIGGHPTLDMNLDMPNKSTRVIFELANGSKLFFNDQRKFGWIKLIQTPELSGQDFIKKLGPEPFDKLFTNKVLKENLLKHKSQPVKAALLDQTILAGVGNIYASEACFNASINPETKIGSLTDLQLTSLYEGILKALSDGIKHGGSSKTHFVDSDGKKGYFLDYAFCYNRAGKDCKRCMIGKIVKIKLGGRGTFYCPNCQK